MAFQPFRLPLTPLLQSLSKLHQPTSSITTQLFKRSIHNHPKLNPRSAYPPPGSFVKARAARPSQAAKEEWSRKLVTIGLGATVGLIGYEGLSKGFGTNSGNAFGRVECESLPLNSAPPPPSATTTAGEPSSILSLSSLSFGATCGICAGVFIKKGLKALAFALGGIFVLLQYLSSQRLVKVDWSRVAGRYDGLVGRPEGSAEGKGYPTIAGVYNRIVDFLTADFQQRATFLAGLALGFRLG